MNDHPTPNPIGPDDLELDGLTPRQHQAILALLGKPTIAAAAKACDIGERTLHTWLDDSAFYAAYLAARRRVMQHTIAQLQQQSTEAVKTLTAIMKDKKASAPARISAARSVLEFGTKGLELEDLEQRIATLERMTEKGDQE